MSVDRPVPIPKRKGHQTRLHNKVRDRALLECVERGVVRHRTPSTGLRVVCHTNYLRISVDRSVPAPKRKRHHIRLHHKVCDRAAFECVEGRIVGRYSPVVGLRVVRRAAHLPIAIDASVPSAKRPRHDPVDILKGGYRRAGTAGLTAFDPSSQVRVVHPVSDRVPINPSFHRTYRAFALAFLRQRSSGLRLPWAPVHNRCLRLGLCGGLR
jgi:hypothetical protein